MRFRPQDEHQTMYVISLLKRVGVLTKSEGSQKWLAPSDTDLHRVARAIDVCSLKKDSLRQTAMILWNAGLRAQHMESVGAISKSIEA
jgi:hypothetical protein